MSSQRPFTHRRITRYSSPEDLLAYVNELRQIKSTGREIPAELEQILTVFKDSLHFEARNEQGCVEKGMNFHA